MIIDFKNVTKYYGVDKILDGVSGIVEERSRIGIIGANGAGKTTILKILTGGEQYDGGEIFIDPKVRVGYLTQSAVSNGDNTVVREMREVYADEIRALERLSELRPDDAASRSEYDRLLAYITAKDAFNIDVKIDRVLNGMGFDAERKAQPVRTLSGGEKTRLALAKLLISDSNLLILDEPTNHLDFATCAWLEEYLAGYKGAVISVTHDRYYLDKVCDSIWELEFGKLTVYGAGYEAYKAEKNEQFERAEKEYEQAMERRHKLEDYVARNLVRASTSAMAKSRRKELEREAEPERPAQYRGQIRVNFRLGKKSWNDVLKLQGLTVSAGGKRLFEGLDADFKAGERIAIVGDNGTGKTTLAKALCGRHGEYEGRIRWGVDVETGVFEQSHEYEEPGKTVLEEFCDAYPALTRFEARSALAGLLFTADDVYKKVGEISGGESARLQLALLAQKSVNVLIMDEPTNHLDMMSKEKLEDALERFEGTEFIVSHDRYLLNRIPDKIIYIENGRAAVFDGKFDEFIASRPKEQPEKPQVKPKKPAAEGYKTKEMRAAEARRRQRISECESKIADAERQIAELEEIISKSGSDYAVLSETCEKLEALRAENDRLTELWLELCEQ